MVLYHHSLNTPKSKPCITIAMYVLCIQPISPVAPAVSDSVCTEWMSHDLLHPAMLQGMTEMLYTVSGSSEAMLNDVEPFKVDLYTISFIDSL